MKLNLYFYIFLLFLFLYISIIKSSVPCDPNGLSFACYENEITLISVNGSINYTVPGPKINGFYDFDVLNSPVVSFLCQQESSTSIGNLNNEQEIIWFPNVSTLGGNTRFQQNSGCDKKRNIKWLIVNSFRYRPSFIVDNLYAYFIVNVEPGCGNISITGDIGSDLKYAAYFQSPTITNRDFNFDLGIYYINGTNLYGTTVNISANTNSPPPSNSYPYVQLNNNGVTHNSIEFAFTEMKYAGWWSIQLTLCGITQTPYQIDQRPYITSINPTTVVEGGGIITISGGNFVGDANAAGTTVIFDGVRQCAIQDKKANQIICHIPARGDNNGYDLPLYVQVKNLISSNKYFSYNLPRITSITQGNGLQSNVFTINGTYLDQTAAIMYARNENNANQIPKNNFTVDTPELISFEFPKDAQQGYLALFINNTGAIPYTSPPIDLDVIPHIDNDTVTSDTIGSEITLTGYFLQVYKYGNVIIPLTIIGIGGSKNTNSNCTEFKNGDIPGYSMKCTISPNVGVGYLLNVMLRNIPVKTITLNYNPPAITSFAILPNGQFQVFGTNLGNDPTLLKFILSTTDGGTPHHTYPGAIAEHLKASCITDSSINNYITGFIYVEVDGRSTNSISYIIKPIIEKVNQVSTYGGTVTITGHYLSLYPGYPTNISYVSLGQSNCPVTKVTDDSIECDLLGTLSTQYSNFTSGTNRTIKVNDDDSIIQNPDQISFNFYAPQVSGFSNVSTDGVVTIYGYSFNDNNLVISIGGKPCINPQVIDIVFRTVSCVIGSSNSSSLAKVPITYDLIVQVDGQIGKNSSFVYVFDPQGTPPQQAGKEPLQPAIWIGLAIFFLFFVYILFHAKKEYEEYKRKKKLAKRLARDAEAQSTYHEKHRHNARLTRKFTKIELMPEEEKKGWQKFKHSTFGWISKKLKKFKSKRN